GRGRGRRDRGEKAGHGPAVGEPRTAGETSAGTGEGTKPHAPEGEGAAQEGAAQEGAAQEGAVPREWPRLMESAEHRTREGGERNEPIEARPLVSDEELSFSMAPSREPRSEPRREPEPEKPGRSTRDISEGRGGEDEEAPPREPEAF